MIAKIAEHDLIRRSTAAYFADLGCDDLKLVPKEVESGHVAK